MARTYQTQRFAAVLPIFLLSLTLMLLQSAGGVRAPMNGEVTRKMALGSSPPDCVNRCMSCKPCEATLVVPSQKRGISVKSSRGEDDSYYLLSWKCMCRNKLYQP